MSASGPRPVDLGADLGESSGGFQPWDDDALLELVTSASLPSVGDPGTLRRMCARAVAAGVAVGALVSYRDPAGSGDRLAGVDPADDVLSQLTALDGIARTAGTRISYVTPHGALYDAVGTYERSATAVLDAVLALDRRLPVLGLPGSALLRGAEAVGMRPVAEGFADRGYTPEGRLVPRREPGGVVVDAAVVADRAVRMATDGVVVAVDGTRLLMPVESICIDGDTKGALGRVRAVRTALADAGVTVRPFAG